MRQCYRLFGGKKRRNTDGMDGMDEMVGDGRDGWDRAGDKTKLAIVHLVLVLKVPMVCCLQSQC